MVQCFHAFCGVSQTQNASFNLTNRRLVMNAGVRCQNADAQRVFNGNLSTTVIGRTGLRRKMRGYPLIGTSQIKGTFVFSGLFSFIRYLK